MGKRGERSGGDAGANRAREPPPLRGVRRKGAGAEHSASIAPRRDPAYHCHGRSRAFRRRFKLDRSIRSPMLL